MIARAGIVAPSWHSTPVEPMKTRWIIAYSRGRFSRRPVENSGARTSVSPTVAERSHSRVKVCVSARSGSTKGSR